MNHQELLSEIVQRIVQQEGSDIHLSELRHPSVRVNGELSHFEDLPVLGQADMKAFFDIFLTDTKKKEFLERKEVDYSYQHALGRFRGNGFIQQGRYGIVLRLIPEKIRTLKELNVPQRLEQFAEMKQGFFLVVGPVGQGKTTTLAALLDKINTERAEHIITIENPIEYLYKEKRSIVDQREVGLDTDGFNTALVSTLRQDVDVILVGEMRDQATMSAALTAAETGHLVFSTLHTNNASQTIDRIIDTFPAGQQNQIRLQLASVLTGVFSQRLLPRISGGMIPAFELMINNNAVANLIREARTHEIDTVIETGSDSGMIDMNRSLAELVRRGEISFESARIQSLNPEMLERLI
jgi:twitching motility protein PilT